MVTESELMEPREGIQKVLEGKFSYIRNFYITRIMMETEYMGDKGYSPFHISSTKYPLFAGNTWAFR
ncbi:hypothetical protein E2C01_090257 [Portunus trituberculatus]|uniref:Uncharacterized protein n=1 Tax=Portunus trituberculatus TaxID=210409 RepID=A0A5B7JFX4_PORTR|nr:hypothetical protein [Portunus trituberculatus]